MTASTAIPDEFYACATDTAMEAAVHLFNARSLVSPHCSQEIDSKPEFEALARNHHRGNQSLSFTLLRERRKEERRKVPCGKMNIGKKKFPLMLYLWLTFWPFHNLILGCAFGKRHIKVFEKLIYYPGILLIRNLPFCFPQKNPNNSGLLTNIPF